MKSLKKEYIKKNINSCLSFTKEQNKIIIYSNSINSEEYLINIIFLKDYFLEKIENKRKIDTDLLFMLHLVHNFPINSPKLFCLTSLSHIGIELCDGKDILEDVIKTKWDTKLSIKHIIIKISEFIQNCVENKTNKLFLGNYPLNYAYDYNLLIKIPHQYFGTVDQIINKKTGRQEKRFLLITSLFFLVFSYKSGYLNYSEIKLVFWASVFSICAMKKEEPTFEFEFNRNQNRKISLYINANDGTNILNTLLYIFQTRGVDYLVQGNEENKKLPGMGTNNLDKKNKEEEDKNSNEENKEEEKKIDDDEN